MSRVPQQFLHCVDAIHFNKFWWNEVERILDFWICAPRAEMAAEHVVRNQKWDSSTHSLESRRSPRARHISHLFLRVVQPKNFLLFHTKLPIMSSSLLRRVPTQVRAFCLFAHKFNEMNRCHVAEASMGFFALGGCDANWTFWHFKLSFLCWFIVISSGKPVCVGFFLLSHAHVAQRGEG